MTAPMRLQRRPRVRRHVAAEDERAAPRRPHEAEDHADGRALAGAVRAEEAEHLAVEDLQVHVGDGRDRAVPLPQTFRAEDLAALRTPVTSVASILATERQTDVCRNRYER